MNIHLRFNESNIAHTTVTVFINNVNSGTLKMRTDEVGSFHQIVSHGCDNKIDAFLSSGKVYEEEAEVA